MSIREYKHDVFLCYFYGKAKQLYYGSDIAKDLATSLREAGLTVYRDYENNTGNFDIEVKKAFRNSLIKVIVLTTPYIKSCERSKNTRHKELFLEATDYSSEYIVPILYEAYLSDKDKWPKGKVKTYFDDKSYYNFSNSTIKARNLPLAIREMKQMRTDFITLTTNPLIRLQYETALLPKTNTESFHCFLSHVWRNVTQKSKVGDNIDLHSNHGQQPIVINTHKQVKVVKDNLEVNKIKCWFDDEQIFENTPKDILSGLVNSTAIIVFITEAYLDKITRPNEYVASELDFAIKVRKANAIIPVVLSPSGQCLDPKNWPSQLDSIKQTNYIDFSTKELRKQNMQVLCKRIRRKVPGG